MNARGLSEELMVRVSGCRIRVTNCLRLFFITALTMEDVLFLSPKFWDLHTDPIASIDGSAATLLTIQYNLCAGTLATYLPEQPSLAPLLQRVLDFEVS